MKLACVVLESWPSLCTHILTGYGVAALLFGIWTLVVSYGIWASLDVRCALCVEVAAFLIVHS